MMTFCLESNSFYNALYLSNVHISPSMGCAYKRARPCLDTIFGNAIVTNPPILANVTDYGDSVGTRVRSKERGKQTSNTSSTEIPHWQS